MRRMARQVETAIQASSQRLHRDPTEEEIAGELQIDLGRYHQWLANLQGLGMATLECADADGCDLLAYTADDAEKQPLRLLERSELERLLAEAIEQIPPMDRTVISLYYLASCGATVHSLTVEF